MRTGYGQKQLFPAGAGPDYIVADLAEAAAKIEELLLIETS